MNTVTIYSLTDPRNNEVFYIGRTKTDLHKRLICHVTVNPEYSGNPKLHERVMDIIRVCKTRPVIEAVDSCETKDRREVEEFWIQQFSAWGFRLLNVRHNRNKNYIPAEKRQKKYTQLTDEEYEMIQMLRTVGDYQVLGQMLGKTDERARQLVTGKSMPVFFKAKVLDYYRAKARKIAQWYYKQTA